MPQFAYTKGRGTADALARAHGHFYAVSLLLGKNRVDRFQQQAGRVKASSIGGQSLSLDLSKAFDNVSRPTIYRTLLAKGVSPTVVQAIQHLHFEARYHYRVGEYEGSTNTSNGIKQGCKIAPYLWSYFTIAFMLLLKDQRSQAWIEEILTIFADDCWGAWIIQQQRDLQQAIADLQLILETLETLHMTVNYQKTAILLKLVGRTAASLRRQITYNSNGITYLKVTVHGKECGIPVKESHEYLGTIVTYSQRLERNMAHRLRAAQHR